MENIIVNYKEVSNFAAISKMVAIKVFKYSGLLLEFQNFPGTLFQVNDYWGTSPSIKGESALWRIAEILVQTGQLKELPTYKVGYDRSQDRYVPISLPHDEEDDFLDTGKFPPISYR